MALLLPSSRRFKVAYTALNDFAGPAAVAIWNLRCQVRGFLAETESPTRTQLAGRFMAGSGIGSMNFTRFAVGHTWERQRNYLGQLLLFQAMAVFEEWLETLEASRTEKRAMMWPTQRYDTMGRIRNANSNVLTTISTWQSSQSNALARAFDPATRTDEPIDTSSIESLVAAFRVFKEARNSLIHGGVGSPKAEAALAIYLSLPHALVSKNPAKARLAVPRLVTGFPVSVDYVQVIGFFSVLMRIVSTVDAYLGVTQKSETQVFLPLWRDTLGVRMNVSPERTKRAKYVTSCLTGNYYPQAADARGIAKLLEAHRLLR